MHKVIFLLLISFTSFHFANCQPPQPGSYVTNSNIDKFEGIWKWTNGSDVIILKFKKFRHTVSDYDEDVLLGSHSYLQNKILIESSMDDYVNIPNNHKKASVYVWNTPAVSADRVDGLLKDITKHKHVEIQIDYIPGTSPEQLQVQLKTYHQTLTKTEQQTGMTLPPNFILVKQ